MLQPSAIVVCGGADSLSGDRLGCFNLSLEGHADCLSFLAKYNVPMLLLGGGGAATLLTPRLFWGVPELRGTVVASLLSPRGPAAAQATRCVTWPAAGRTRPAG